MFQKNYSWFRLNNYAVEFFLASIVVFSPLIYGSITIIPLTIVELLSILAISFFLMASLFTDNKFSFLKISLFPAIFFAFFILLQIIPLPFWAIKFLSPATTSLYQTFRADYFFNNTLSIYPEATVNILLQFISYLAVFFVTVNYLDDERKCKRLVAVIILTGFLLSLYGILIKHNVSRASYGTFTNRNHFAAYIQLIIPLSLSYALISK